MYIPPRFRQTDQAILENFIRENPFATLVSVGPDGVPLASHVPLELEIEGGVWRVHGHVSRANPQGESFGEGASALAIFQGAHHYVSNSWYDHANVPTWNYLAVHLSGKIRRQTPDEVRRSIEKLMGRYEPPASSPTSFEKLPEALIHKDLRGLIGFKMTVEKIEGKWKLSQNRDEKNYRAVIEALEKLGNADAQQVAAEMRAWPRT